MVSGALRIDIAVVHVPLCSGVVGAVENVHDHRDFEERAPSRHRPVCESCCEARDDFGADLTSAPLQPIPAPTHCSAEQIGLPNGTGPTVKLESAVGT